MAELPIELVLRIIECLPSRAVAISPSENVTARCIRNFTRISKTTYPVALRLLYRHCLWIDSSEKLRRLLHSLDAHLSPSRSRHCRLPYVDLMPCLQNLYLAPFGTSLDDLPSAIWVFELLARMRNSLRRLVVDMPLVSLAPENDHLDVRPKLRAAFIQLECVEEFTTVDDELFLSVRNWHTATPQTDRPVWSYWRNLRRLALYSTDLSQDHDAYVTALAHLQSLAFAQREASSFTGCMNFLLRAKASNVAVLELVYDGYSSRTFMIDTSSGEKEAHPTPLQECSCIRIFLSMQCTCDIDDGASVVTSWTKSSAIDTALWDMAHLPDCQSFTGMQSWHELKRIVYCPTCALRNQS